MQQSKAKKRALSNAQHQARWRARRTARLAAAEALLAKHDLTVAVPVLRKSDEVGRPSVLRKSAPDPDEVIDDALVRLRQQGARVLADYLSMLKSPGLTRTESDAIAAYYLNWRQQFQSAAKRARPRRESTVTARLSQSTTQKG